MYLSKRPFPRLQNEAKCAAIAYVDLFWIKIARETTKKIGI